MQENITVVGGGIIGLCSAYYLNKAGYNITVIDRADITDGCSFGNMGFISPSHFVPLASPGIIAEGLKFMLRSNSPFYMKPRLNAPFLQWAYKFYRNSNEYIAQRNALPLSSMLQLSRALVNDLKKDLGETFSLEEKGCLMMCRNEHTLKHEKDLAIAGELLGLKVQMLDAKEVQALEPEVEVSVRGAALFKDDCHLNPGLLMKELKNHLISKHVDFRLRSNVIGFERNSDRVKAVITDKETINCDQVIVATGSWLPATAKLLGIKMLLQAGKGYSFTYDNVEKNIKYPAILVDARCAVSPWQNKLRIGGTMEFSGINDNVLTKRMQGIYDSVRSFYPGLALAPPKEKIWHGLRPVTPDGIPYLGRAIKYKNVIFAGGHAMLGLSQATGTGKIVSEIVAGSDPSIDITAFNPNR